MNELKLIITKVKEYFCDNPDSESYIWSIIQQDNAYYVPQSLIAYAIKKEYAAKLLKLSQETNSWVYKDEIITLDEWLKIYDPKPPIGRVVYSPCLWDDLYSKHPTKIPYDGTVQELVQKITNLRYDALANVFQVFEDQINKDAIADQERGRKKLAKELHELANILKQAKEKTQTIWNICAPYMKGSS